jgi:hypothetical protein
MGILNEEPRMPPAGKYFARKTSMLWVMTQNYMTAAGGRQHSDVIFKYYSNLVISII